MEVKINKDLEWMYSNAGKVFDYYNIRKFDNGTTVVTKGQATIVFETETTFYVTINDKDYAVEKVTKMGKYNILDAYTLNKVMLSRRISVEDFIDITLFTTLDKKSVSTLIESEVTKAIDERNRKKDWRSGLEINDVKDWLKDV